MRSLVAFALGLAACTPADQDLLARETARAAVIPVLEERYPTVPAAPVANCVIDNASADEIIALATAGATQNTTRVAELTVGVLRRPDTVRCAIDAGLNYLVLQGAA